MSAQLTVFFPALPAAALERRPGLVPLDRPLDDPLTAACALFGLHDADPPLAPVTYTHDFGQPPPAWCARVDPVCLMAAGATLRLLPLDGAPLTNAQARDLFALASTANVIPGVSWQYAAPLRWYLLADPGPDLATCAPQRLPGGHVAAGQPRGTDAPAWQSWLNELQMRLFDSAVNHEREAHDLPPANALWLWGGGRTPPLAPSPFDAVWTHEPLIGGLTRLAGGAPEPLPADLPQWLAGLPREGRFLLAPDADDRPWHDTTWWLTHLQAAVDDRRLQTVELHLADARLTLNRRGLLTRLRQAWR
ncbi:hypothetical protein [Immundisolibacter sp.]|uniref:hypothetical protein n=1 Tax=Immundisolibacter sp. TaxID=1934948 RepID=UPI003F828F22